MQEAALTFCPRLQLLLLQDQPGGGQREVGAGQGEQQAVEDRGPDAPPKHGDPHPVVAGLVAPAAGTAGRGTLTHKLQQEQPPTPTGLCCNSEVSRAYGAFVTKATGLLHAHPPFQYPNLKRPLAGVSSSQPAT